MQKQLTSGMKASDLDTSYSRSKDVELATSFRTTFGNNRVTFADTEGDYRPPQNVLNEVQSKQRNSTDCAVPPQQRFQLAKSLTLQDRIEVQKLKYMKFNQFVDSLQIDLDMNSQYQKYSDQNIYFFQITSKRQEDKGQQHTWLIRRRYLDLVAFDYKVRKEMKEKKLKKQMPDLPFNKEPKTQNAQDILNFLEAYLKAMIELEHVCKTVAFWEFIELSDYNHDGIVKVKESFIKKRAGGHFQKRNCFASCINPFNAWKKRYVVITSEGIMYSIGNRAPKTKIREMMLFDHNFDIKYGMQKTQRELGIQLLTTTRRLQLEAYDLFHFVDIIAAIKDAMSLSPYVELHRYDSFAPIRQKSYCQWYIDGEGYFSSLYEKLINADHEVFITDWWLSPQMYLQRPVNEYTNQETRLDRVLEKIANRGVKVYIIVYREPTIALNLNSNYTKSTLQSLSKNIRVMRHPSTLIPLLWSHHEKMVVIDQVYGFLGGLDLCYGRWDSQSHPLIDQNPAKIYFPGIDYSNARIKDFVDVKDFNRPEINRQTQPRMPWHDIAMMVIGDPVRDLVRHFIQYWNFAKVDIYSKDNKEQLDHLIPGTEDKEKNNMTQKVSNYWHRILSKFKSKKKTEDEMDGFHGQSADIERNNSVQISSIINEVNKMGRSKTIQVNKKNKANRFSAYLDKIKEEIEDNHGNQPQDNQYSQSKRDNGKKEKVAHNRVNHHMPKKEQNDTSQANKQEQSQPIHHHEIIEGDQSQTNLHNETAEDKNPHEDTIKNILADLTVNKIKNQENDSKEVPRPKKNSKIEMSFITNNNNNNSNNNNSTNNSKNQRQRENSAGVNLSMILPKLLGQNNINGDSPSSQHVNNSGNLNNSVMLSNNFHSDISGIAVNEKRLPNQFITNMRQRKSEINQMRFTRSTSLAIIPSIHANQAKETYKPFSLEYEDMHELNKYNLYVPLIEKLRKNYEESAESDQNYYILYNQQIARNTSNNSSQMGRSFTQGSSNFFNIFRNPKAKAKVTPTQNNGDSPDNTRRQFSGFSQSSHNNSILNASKDDDDSFDNSFGLFPKKRNFDRLKLENNAYQQSGSCICQMLRSSCSWSLGLEKKNHEMSIHLAYIDLITSSTSYIYIENQFFISCSAGSKVKNLIAQALIERIKKAADNNELFKVIVVMPLLPGFEGEVNDSGSGVMKCQLHWEYSTISRGGTSILEELRQHPKIDDPSKYIQFYGLRQHSIIDNKPATEIIYVHSKLMIVDDNYVIMGSANINDRSMLGTRDSEIAMIVEDTEKVHTNWNEKVKKVGKFSHTLRTALYQEHFGLSAEEASDPLCELTSNLIVSRSKLRTCTNKIIKQQNTLIYRQAFACYPDDKVETLAQLDEFQKSKIPEAYFQFKDNIIGNAVELPLDFLKRENLNFSISQKEYFVPDENFT